MPTLPFPYPVLPSGGDLSLRSADDWIADLPIHVRSEEDAPARDAIAEGAAGIFLSYQQKSSYAAAQSDSTRATGAYLDGFVADAGLARSPTEQGQDELIRDRLFATPAIVTPTAIKALVDAILAPYTTKRCVAFESVLDRWFVSDGTAGWHSFVGDGLVDVDPQYADRRYELRGTCGPGGAWSFPNHEGRYFILRIPVLDLAENSAFAFDGTQPTYDGDRVGLYVTDGTVVDGLDNAFVFASSAIAMDVYQSIADVVELAKGSGIRFMLIVDPKL